MRKLLLILLVLTACTKVTPPKIYICKINRDELNSVGSGLSPDTKIDTIKAINDTEAYFGGAKSYWAEQYAAKLTKYRISVPHSFTVEDENGIDLRIKLSKKVVDSIDKFVGSIAKKM